MSTNNGNSRALLEKLAKGAVGLDVEYLLASGETTRRIYLDSTASTLRLQIVQDTLERYLPYYSNTHSMLHFGAKLSTSEYRWTHDMVLQFINADPEEYTAFFVGSGTTAGLNRIARTLAEKRADKKVVITTIMEHHSNDLPHRKHAGQVVHIPAAMANTSIGQIHMERLEEALKEHEGNVNYVAVTGVSNVTGIVNPIYDVAELAHKYGALIVVDAAQMAAHLPIQMSRNENSARDIDVLTFSGHKIYAPGSPGVVVTRKDLFADLEPQEVGGGMVDDVWLEHYKTSTKFPDREEAGTPNICGAIGLAAALYALHRVGMDEIAEEEREIIEYTIKQLRELDLVIIYGETDCGTCERAGAVSFNIRGAHHALTAAILNDYFNIAVRNECFCAHPYVREMITEVLAEESEDDIDDAELEALANLHKGMVRASFGVYNTREDVDALVDAVRVIAADIPHYESLYDQVESGDYVHKTFRFDHTRLFSVRGTVDAWLES
ncbi:MAG: aminotransferase [Planctomycetes bacterium]|nr:aminotransferase [Planctomycetota bacterium]